MVSPPRTPVRVDRLRALNVPRPVTVYTSTQGTPIAVGEWSAHPLQSGEESATAPADRPEREISRAQQVETVIETWHIDDEWWREPITRRYVEVVLQGGTHVVLFEDLVTGAWFAQTP